jgi:hypothetical protein
MGYLGVWILAHHFNLDSLSAEAEEQEPARYAVGDVNKSVAALDGTREL